MLRAHPRWKCPSVQPPVRRHRETEHRQSGPSLRRTISSSAQGIATPGRLRLCAMVVHQTLLLRGAPTWLACSQIKLADVDLRMRRIDCNRTSAERPIENFPNCLQPRVFVRRPHQRQQRLGNIAHMRLKAPAKLTDAANRSARRYQAREGYQARPCSIPRTDIAAYGRPLRV